MTSFILPAKKFTLFYFQNAERADSLPDFINPMRARAARAPRQKTTKVLNRKLNMPYLSII